MRHPHWNSLAGKAWLLTWASYLLLLGQQGADILIHQGAWIIWVGKLLPLLIFMPGMLQDRPRSHIWLCFVCLMYFLFLVERAFAQPGHPLPIIGLGAVVVLFCSAMMYVRWRARGR